MATTPHAHESSWVREPSHQNQALDRGKELDRILLWAVRRGQTRMIRVTSERTEVGSALRVEGRLVEPWVRELAMACEPFLTAGRPLRLDLSGVLFVSREGVALVRELAERGVQVTGSSHFVASLLQEGSHDAVRTQVR